MRVIVVGCGIIGLACGRLLARTEAGAEIVAIDKEAAVGQHQTSHNSGVVHAGLYYEPGSLKAQLCRRGVELMREFCEVRGIAYEECGKVVVATSGAELERLDRLSERAAANGVPGLRRLDRDGLRGVEPHADGVAALHSPTTAITDYAAVATALAGELRAAGGEVRLESRVRLVRRAGAGAAVELENGEELRGDRVIVCAGLQSDRLAIASGEPAGPAIVPFRGEYWQLREESADLVRGLIYPVPDPTLPFLGVHLTRTVGGQVLVGPSAVLALSREGYRRGSVRLEDLADTARWPGTWRLCRRHWRAGGGELARALSKRSFLREAQRYVPELHPRDAVRAPAGVRAQAVDRDGGLVDDFRLGGDGQIVWVRNAPSPAATSSLAIAEELVARLAPV
jgi:(S)-2-hydroxyglutarate dehydrogenase